MIYSLSGKLVHTESDLAVIECAGVGYACKTTFSTLQQIAGKSEVKLYTHLAVKEDAVELFGFATKEELKSFRMLISVSGVGPKAGLAILSACTPSQFALAVATGDSKAFTKIKGIGTKIAQRIVLELKIRWQKRIPYPSEEMRLRALRLFQAELWKKLSQPLWCLDIPRAKQCQ